MAFLGIDVGSTALKATLYSVDGAMLCSKALEYGERKSPEELPAEVLWETLKSAIVAIVSTSGHADIKAAAISSHGESFVPVDRFGVATGPFVLNTASMGTKDAVAFSEHFGRSIIFERTGLPPHSMYSLPKIRWLKHARPESFRSAAMFLCVEDYLLTRLGVGSFISASLASRTMALDIESATWIDEFLAFAGISAANLSVPVASGTSLGRASPKICSELGIPHSVQWVAGGHDQGCCSLGAGGIREGIAVDGTGTFECISIPVTAPVLKDAALNCNFPTEFHTVPNLKLTLSYIAGGVALKWFRDVVGRREVDLASSSGKDAYELILSNLPKEPTHLFVLPHLVGTGTPWLNSEAKGAVVGIDPGTSFEAFAKASIEGVTLEMQWNLELQEAIGIHVGRIHAVGGGSRSPQWLQMKADIFDREVLAVPGEASCAGAAICAAMGVGQFDSYGEATEAFVTQGALYSPRHDFTTRYREKGQAYRELAGKLYGFHAPHGLLA